MTVNTFFLALNGAIVTLIGIFWRDRPNASGWLPFPLVLMALAGRLAWWRLVENYCRRTDAVLLVIYALEERAASFAVRFRARIAGAKAQ